MSFNDSVLENDTLRWGSSFLITAALYAGVTVLVMTWATNFEPVATQPLAAMMVELAPMPVAPEAPAQAAPPGPAQEEKLAEPEPLPEPEIEPPPEIPTIEKAEVALPPKPEPTEEIQELVEEVAEQQQLAPPSIIAPPAAVAAAPTEGAVSLMPSNTTASWQSVLLAHLEKHKRYPRRARRRGHEAVVYVRVTINRDGQVISSQLSKSCPYKALNRETLALITRAQPLPPPPSELSGNTVEFVVPVAFSLKV